MVLDERFSHSRADSASAKKRLEELRERRNTGIVGSPLQARNTVIINMIIEVVSAFIYCVGVYYAIRFLNLRRPFMEEIQYRIFIGVFLIVSVVWFGFLIARVRKSILRIKEIKRVIEES